MSVNYQNYVCSTSLIFITFWSLCCSRIQKLTFVSHLTERANRVLIEVTVYYFLLGRQERVLEGDLNSSRKIIAESNLNIIKLN